MRLAQAARKISITTEDIVNFLAKRDILVEKDSNTKLSEEAIKLLFSYYDVEIEQKQAIETDKAEKQVQTKEAEASIAPSFTEESENIDVMEDQQLEIAEEEDVPAEIQPAKKSFKTVGELLENDFETDQEDLVIKAPKVQLQGLNVLGKIDLPEPKPKKEAPQKDNASAEIPKKTEHQDRRSSRSQRVDRREKLELSPAEIRKRAELKERRKRERLEAERKRKREAHYRENILKPQQEIQKEKTKKRKRKTETLAVSDTLKRPKPKTVLGKFWRWLNT